MIFEKLEYLTYIGVNNPFEAACQFFGLEQGNFKGESVVVAILPSCMEASYCTSGFFIAK